MHKRLKLRWEASCRWLHGREDVKLRGHERSLWGTCRPPRVIRLGVAWRLCRTGLVFPTALVGQKMDKLKTLNKQKQIITTTTTTTTMATTTRPTVTTVTTKTTANITKEKSLTSKEDVDPFRRRGSVVRSPPPPRGAVGGLDLGSTSSVEQGEEAIAPQSTSRKMRVRKLSYDDEVFKTDKCVKDNIEEKENEKMNEEKENEKMKHKERTDNVLCEVMKERQQLEEYLFNESNKINKPAMKFILSKWMILENRLQQEILEKEKLLERYTYSQESTKIGKQSYAMAIGTKTKMNDSMRTVDKTIRRQERHEVILIKPDNNDDARTNEEIKSKVMDVLKDKRSVLKIKGIRQLRSKGILLEVNDKEDIEIINKTNMQDYGLRAMAPKKQDPSIIIYDVDKDYNVDELKDDFINKNFSQEQVLELERSNKQINFKFCFKNKINTRVNWIVQIPADYYQVLLDRGRIYLSWRMHRVNEYIGLLRCFKCCGYGHMAKDCGVSSQVCENCGSLEHGRDGCPLRDRPVCPNCIRTKRKDANHHFKSRTCPE